MCTVYVKFAYFIYLCVHVYIVSAIWRLWSPPSSPTLHLTLLYTPPITLPLHPYPPHIYDNHSIPVLIHNHQSLQVEVIILTYIHQVFESIQLVDGLLGVRNRLSLHPLRCQHRHIHVRGGLTHLYLYEHVALLMFVSPLPSPLRTRPLSLLPDLYLLPLLLQANMTNMVILTTSTLILRHRRE